MIKSAKIFPSGRSQAVRLPKEFRFENSEVFIEKIGDSVVLRPKFRNWQAFFESDCEVSSDFMSDRNQPAAQKREEL